MSSFLLIIDTAHPTARVILAEGEKILGMKEWVNTPNVGTDLLVYIEEVLRECGVEKTAVSRIGVHTGPGSYGLIRTGITTATILAQTLEADLIPVTGETTEEMLEQVQTLPPISVIEPKYSQSVDN